MRKLLISLLLAGAAATPALADPPKDRQQTREERQQAREDRQQSRQESRPERVQSNQPEQAQPSRPERAQPPTEVRQQTSDRANRGPAFRGNPNADANPGPAFRGNPNADAIRAERDARARIVESLRDRRAVERDTRPVIDGNFRDGRADDRAQRREDRADARDLRQPTRPVPPVMRNRVPVVSNVPRPGTQPPLRVDHRRSPEPQWNTNWRHNGKYDWHNWRNHNRSRFHLGFYFDPFGWGYQPWSIGWRMWPSYYGSRYWINDPWQYRLPYAPPGYRWIRYWNDAVLVDTWTGEVADVIHNFFW